MNSRVRRCAIGALLFLIAHLSSPTLAYTRALPEATIGASVLQARSSIDSVSGRATAAANDALLRAAGAMRFLVDVLRNSQENILDKRPNDLNAAQKRLFQDIQSGVAALQAAADEPEEQARESIAEIRRLTDSVRAIDGPVAVRSSPVILAPTGISEIPVTLMGQRLSRANPRLWFGDVEATRTDLTEQTAAFTVPSAVFRSNDRTPVSYSGRLLLAVQACRWKIHCKLSSRTYAVNVVVLPTRLATVQISFDRRTSQRIYDQESPSDRGPAAAVSDKVYSSRIEYSNDDLTLMGCTRRSEAPHAAGYFIDTNTVSVKVTDQQAESTWRMLDAAASGFSIELCAQPQISKIGKTPGSISVETTWKEYRMGDVISARESASRKLDWGTQIKESLPAEAHALAIELEYFDGSRATFTRTANDRYVEMNWNADTHQLVLTPRLRASAPDVD